MALERGKFGIEYNPRPVDDDSSGAGWIFVAVVLAASVVLVAAGVRRFLASSAEAEPAEPAQTDVVVRPTPPATHDQPVTNYQLRTANHEARAVAHDSQPNRPQAARNLLLKLEKAEAAQDVELAVSTIEQLRALPGEAVADLDDSLARRLGDLNMRRLFTDKNRQWVKAVTVRRGDSATRIASENGSTLASLLKLNELPSADRLGVGQKLNVMDHPQFTLVVHRVAKYADLSLKGKFFRRYDVTEPVRAAEGSYETTSKLRAFLAEKGISFSPEDRAQLELMLPPKTPVLVSEL